MKKVNVFAVFMLIMCLSLLNILNVNSKDYSERENRELAPKPQLSWESFVDGNFFQSVNDYISDRFFCRDTLVDMSSSIKSTLADNPVKRAFQKDEDVSIIKMDGIGNPVIRYDDGIYFVFKSDRLQINKYTKALNSIYYKLENIDVYAMLVPTALEFQDKSAEKFGITSQKQQIEYASKMINKNIEVIDTYTPLSEHKDEYIYFRSDHHWTPLGAYYCYKNLADKVGFEPVECTLNIEGNFRGSFSNYTNDPSTASISDMMSSYNISVPYWCHGSLSSAKDAVQMEKMYHDDKDGYKKIFGGDTGYIRVETMNKNGKRLLIIKDSYANALVPYLTEYYDRIIMIDPRYFKDNLYETIASERITDVMFVNNTETISDSVFIRKLEELGADNG